MLIAITPFWTKKGVSEAIANGNPLIFIPLHKGADGFLFDEQFKTFYWPFLKKIIMDLLTVGTPQQVRDHVKNCIDVAGKGGGYIMANGAFFNDVKPENVKAVVETTKEYGVYK